ncbi:MAG TPA: hypothetical protein VER96_21790 [Polyangiaceae bacterium]|nr:hypothetical protein [Polyangiaceae bacterium]
MSKRRRTRNKPRPKPVASADNNNNPLRRRARLTLQTLEVTRGHDGFLRGKPEPAVLVAAYRVNGELPASLVGRLLVRVRLQGDMPCSIPLVDRELRYDARVGVAERLVMLAFAVEENNGEGMAALYAAFENPGQLLLYNASESVPSPLTLGDWAKSSCSPPAARPIETLLGGESLEKIADSDQFIAACAFSLSAHAKCDDAWRLPFLGRDERNDWTLLARMRVD